MSKNTNLSFLTDFLTADIVNSRVGMNNVSPQSTFDVTGTGKFSGILTLGSTVSNGTYTYTLPSATGTLALTSDIPSVSGYVPYTGANQSVDLGNNVLTSRGLNIDSIGGTAGALNLRQATSFSTWSGAPFTSIYATTGNRVVFSFSNDNRTFTLDGSLVSAASPRTFTFPDATGTLALVGGAGVGTVTSVAATAGTGISVSGSPITTSGTLTITNTAPDQVVALTASTGISISGTYPNFTITNTSPSSGGTVTSVGLSSVTSGVTIGSTPITSSGTITLAIATASGSQNGLLSSTDWTTFNGKQNALTNPVTGTGTTNYLPKFTGSSTIGNSLLSDNGTNIGLGIANPTAGRLQINVSDTTTAAHFQVVDGTTTLANSFVTNFRNANDGNSRYSLSSWQAQNAVGNDQIGFIGVQSITGGSNYTPNLIFGQKTGASSYTTRMTLDTSGNLGLGVTPSAWNSTSKALQLPSFVSLSNQHSGALNLMSYAYESSPNVFTYGDTGVYPTRLCMNPNDGTITFFGAGTGTIGNVITWASRLAFTSTGAATFINGAAKLLEIASNTATGGYTRFTYNTSTSIGYIGSSSQLSGSGIVSDLELRADNNLFLTTSGGSMKLASTGAATFSSTITAATLSTFGTAVAAQNVQLNLNGVSGKAQRIEFQNSGVGQWLMGAGAASETSAFELYNHNGQMALSFAKATSAATFVSTVTAKGYGVNNGGFRGGTYAYVDVAGSGSDNSLTLFSEGGANQGNIYFCPNGSATKVMTINTSSNVGIGFSAISYKLQVAGEITTHAGTNTSYYAYMNYLGTTYNFGSSENTDNVDFKIAGGTTWTTGGNFRFWTQTGASSPVERMRITSTGNVLIGTTTTIGPVQGKLDVLYDGILSYGMNLRTTYSSGGLAISFVNSSGSQVGNINTTFSATSYNTSSDYRLKTDLKDYNGMDIINKIKTYDFKWKSENSRSYGVIAHELKEVIDYVVHGQKDSVTMQGVDYSKLVPIMVKAIQEQQAQIQELKNKLS